MSTSELITSRHLERLAMIYICQSSPQQVLSNLERLPLQYALKQRDQDLRCPPARVEVIDADLGLTAAAAQHRAGFKELLARVTLEEVFHYFTARTAMIRGKYLSIALSSRSESSS